MRFEDAHTCDVWCEVAPLGIGQPPKPWCERFQSKILYIDDCWIWKSAQNKTDSQRNRLNFSTRSTLFQLAGLPCAVDACRWIYERTIDQIPSGLTIDHFVCENWRCVNPFHLEPVTNLENQKRYRKTRSNWVIRRADGTFAGRKGGDANE